MLKNTFCPISNKKTDEYVARLVASFTVILLVVYILTSSVIPVLFLVLDFFIRSIEKPKYSPLAIVSKWILRLLQAKPHLINAGPKIFAARIGLLFTFLIALSALAGFDILALIFTAIIGICALLEAAIGFCLGCKIYPFMYKLIHQNRSSKNKLYNDFQI